MDFLKDESISTGMLRESGTFKKATKRAQKYERDIEKLLIDKENGGAGADQSLAKKMGELDNNTLLNYQNYQTSGAVIKKESFAISSIKSFDKSRKFTVYPFL